MSQKHLLSPCIYVTLFILMEIICVKYICRHLKVSGKQEKFLLVSMHVQMKDEQNINEEPKTYVYCYIRKIKSGKELDVLFK